MKKIVLSLASVLAATAFAPEASALPLFARQTGMACNACHFQHFPLLNSFGRSFKASGYTLIGAQGKIEGTQNLSVPDTLNMAALTSFGYEKTNQTPDASGVTKNAGNGTFFVPSVGGELSLFFGGRVGENSGFLSELGLGGASAALGSAKLPILYEVASGTHAGIVPFATDDQGASYGMELLNTGANAVQQMSNTPGNANSAHTMAISAQQYIGTSGAADGLAFVMNNDMGSINISKYQQTGIANGTGATLGSTYMRAAMMIDVAGWDTGFGIQNWSGQSLTAAAAAGVDATGAPYPAGIPTLAKTKASAIDAQMQGALAGMPTGFYFSYARAPAGDVGGLANTYNSGTLTRSSFNIAGEIGVVPEVLTLGAAIRRGKSGVDEGLAATGTANGANASDNAIFLTATYKLQQNMLARLSYTSSSGSYWDLPSATAGLTNAQETGSKTTTINLYTLF